MPGGSKDGSTRHPEVHNVDIEVIIDGVPLAALLDSGNNFRSAISKDLAVKHKWQWVPLKDRVTVVGADKSQKLKIVGETLQFLPFCFGKKRLDLKVLVIDNLQTSVNISAPLLRRLGAIIDFSNNTVTDKKAFTLPMLGASNNIRATLKCNVVAATDPSAAEASTKLPVRYESNMDIAPKTLKKVFLQLDRAAPAHQDWVLEGSTKLDEDKAFTVKNALVTADSDKRIAAFILNVGDDPICLKSGEIYGWARQYLPSPPSSVEPRIAKVSMVKDLKAAMREKLRKGEDVGDKSVLPPEAGGLKGKLPSNQPSKELLLGHRANEMSKEERLQWLITAFDLDYTPCITSIEERSQVAQLLESYWDLFSHDGEYGHTRLVTHPIVLKDGAQPVKQKQRQVPLALHEELKKQIETWKRHKVIEESNSPWAANLVCVPKKNGKTRFCVDWRGLNKATVSDSYPCPSTESCLQQLAGSKYFSSIDLVGAFHCVDIPEEDRPKTSFLTPWGSYQMRRLGFGLKNGPATYCRLTDMILQGIPVSMAVPFLDDTLIIGSTFDEHLEAIRRVMEAFKNAKMRISPEKCEFFKSAITFLGHRISPKGVEPSNEYKLLTTMFEFPKTKSEGRSWLSFHNFFRRHSPNFAAVSKPWIEATKGISRTESTIEPTPELEKSFKQLNDSLRKAPILCHPLYTKEGGQFILNTDFSGIQIGATLTQIQNGEERLICFGSKLLDKSQRNYASSKGELLAGVFFMRKWSFHLRYRKFLWRTDNSALTYWQSQASPPPTIDRWLSFLAEHDHDVEHRPGKLHGDADGFSRLPKAPPMSPEEVRTFAMCTIFGAAPVPTGGTVYGYTAAELQAKQDEDPDLSCIKTALQMKSTLPVDDQKLLSSTGQVYRSLWPQLLIDRHGLLRAQFACEVTGYKRSPVCIPQDMAEDVAQEVHDMAGHMALAKTLAVAKRHVFFPRMSTVISDAIATCEVCQKSKSREQPQRHTYVPTVHGFPFAKIAIDHVGPLPPGSVTKSRYLLVAMDTFSKWPEAFPVKSTSAEETVMTLEKELISRFGAPQSIHSDNHASFRSRTFSQFADKFGIELTNTTSYHPAANMVERLNQTLGRMLKAVALRTGQNWEKVLPECLFALRSHQHKATGIAPYHLLFGRDASTSLENIFGNPNEDVNASTPAEAYGRDLRRRIEAAHKYARVNLAKEIQRQRRVYNKKTLHLAAGDLVWLWTPVAATRKLASYWTGPWVVTTAPEGATMVRVKPHPQWNAQGRSMMVTIDRLKEYKSRKVIPFTAETDVQMPGDEFAEAAPTISTTAAPTRTRQKRAASPALAAPLRKARPPPRRANTARQAPQKAWTWCRLPDTDDDDDDDNDNNENGIDPGLSSHNSSVSSQGTFVGGPGSLDSDSDSPTEHAAGPAADTENEEWASQDDEDGADPPPDANDGMGMPPPAPQAGPAPRILRDRTRLGPPARFDDGAQLTSSSSGSEDSYRSTASDPTYTPTGARGPQPPPVTPPRPPFPRNRMPSPQPARPLRIIPSPTRPTPPRTQRPQMSRARANDIVADLLRHQK